MPEQTTDTQCTLDLCGVWFVYFIISNVRMILKLMYMYIQIISVSHIGIQ